MLLGVVYHATLMYSFYGWTVTDPQTSDALGVISYLLHSFRMPAFFLISGYFSAMSLGKRGGAGYVGKKFLRLGLPMMTALLTINVAIWHVTYGYQAGGVIEGLCAPQFFEQWSSNRIFAHLWFLQVLLVLCLTHWAARRMGLRLGSLARTAPGWLLALVTPLAVVGVMIVNDRALAPSWLMQPGWFWPGMMAIGIYAPFFALGAYMRDKPSCALDETRSPRLLGLGLVGVVCAWAPMMIAARSGFWAAAVQMYSEALLSMIGALASLALARRWWQRPSPIFQSLIDASYSVYLLHVLAVLAIGQFLLDYSWSPWLKFSLTLGATLVLVFALHTLVIARVGWLRLLFNGQSTHKAAKAPKETAPVELSALNPPLLGD